MSEEADPLETISRYLLEGEIRRDNTIRHSAFTPPTNLRHSVFRIDSLSDEEIWNLAIEYVEPHRGKVIGRGDLLVSQVLGENLRVVPADPPPRHADICGWPPDDRERRVTVAKVLAAKASPAKKRDA
jgi:hypothetical protein